MKQFLVLILSVALFATPLTAQDVSSQIADQLRAQGYENVEVSKTWLGRLRIEASSGTQTREIIVNPRTGEILRDFLSNSNSESSADIQILDRPARNTGAGQSGPSNQDGGRPSLGGDRGSLGPSRDPQAPSGPKR